MRNDRARKQGAQVKQSLEPLEKLRHHIVAVVDTSHLLAADRAPSASPSHRRGS